LPPTKETNIMSNNTNSLASTLTRELDIRFIDARRMVNEAKSNLGILGYPEEGDERRICRETRHFFKCQSQSSKERMWRLSATFEAIKDPPSSSFSMDGSYNSSGIAHQQDGGSDDSTELVLSSSTRSTSSRRSVKGVKRRMLGMMGHRV
jgi:hypothetical protein